MEYCQASKCKREPSVKLYGVWLCDRHDQIASDMMQRGHLTVHAVTAMIPNSLRTEVQQ